MELGKYSIGVGDRFAHQAKAQLSALKKAKTDGILITPVWNKSYREHQIINSQPSDTRRKADLAVKEQNWNSPYFVDADHIGLNSVDHFLESCDFFTLDVADYIGRSTDESRIKAFVQRLEHYSGIINFPGIEGSILITGEIIRKAACKFLYAVEEAGRIYRYIEEKKGKDNIIIEVSMDETDSAQTPIELLLILAALSFEKIPVQTIAPKFSGRFNKGVDYAGDVNKFAKEFEEDVAVIRFAVNEFSLPGNLKLSVHSGSDKFSIYPVINKTLKKFDAGIHLKTAGTTWLEELIGLATSGGEGLQIAKDIYRKAYSRYDELCGPYKTVIDININELPVPDEVEKWDGNQFASTLRHDRSDKRYNMNFRQLLHVGYKVAAELGECYLSALEKNEKEISENVIENLLERHIKRIFY